MPIYQKCIPDFYHASIFEIPYDSLIKQGIKTLFFDLDNTLIAYDQDELNDKEISLLHELNSKFKIVIMSNSGYKRVSYALRNIDIPFLWHAMKPTKIGFKKALEIHGSKKEEVMMIGDQLMTDVYGAHRAGLNVILVGSVKRSSDRKLTKMNRMIEHKMIKKIKHKAPKLYQERLALYVENHTL